MSSSKYLKTSLSLLINGVKLHSLNQPVKLNLFNKIKVHNQVANITSHRSFSTSQKQNAIPPLLWIFAKPITKLGAMLVGRGFRKWWASLPEVKRKLFIDHLKRNKIRYGVLMGGSSGASYVFYESHCELTPITSRKRFMLFSSSQLKDIENFEKEQIFKLFENNILGHYSPYANRALRVAQRLFIANKEFDEVNAINWQLTVINADIVNAAAFPSGELIVFTGLLDFVENDDELATILAHEMSHAILQHAAEEVSHSRIIDIISIALAGIVWAILPSDLTALIAQYVADRFLKLIFELPYSRSLEKEADFVGLMMSAKACFDVRYSSIFWERMNQTDELKMPEFLSTHPANENRAKDLEELMPFALQLRKECKCNDLPKHIEAPKLKKQEVHKISDRTTFKTET